MNTVGFEPTQLSLVELESTPLDHSHVHKILPLLQFLTNKNIQFYFIVILFLTLYTIMLR